jgi:hypothetical protein
LYRKYPNTSFTIDGPLLGLAVRIAAVVDETSVVGLQPGVYHQIPFQCQEVETGQAAFLSCFKSFLHHRHVEDFTDIFYYKISTFQIHLALQAPPPDGIGMERYRMRHFTDAHTPIPTGIASRAVFITFSKDGSVDAIRRYTTRIL